MTELKHLEAVVFDMDGVLAETEADGHRVAFNTAFTNRGIDANWDVEVYGKLVEISGGKERMRHFFTQHPGLVEISDDLIMSLHKEKTAIFQDLVKSQALPPRPGTAQMFAALKDHGLPFALATTSNEKSANTLLASLFGDEIHAAFTEVLAGDIVKNKKPDPEIYNLAAQKLSVNPGRSVVVEDTRNGLLAAKAAGFLVCVTTSQYSRNEDFTEADMVLSSLGSNDEPCEVIKSPMPLVTPGQCTLSDFDNLVEHSAS
jgi:HAD superfamily hydrolase (TIGR01509 family)